MVRFTLRLEERCPSPYEVLYSGKPSAASGLEYVKEPLRRQCDAAAEENGAGRKHPFLVGPSPLAPAAPEKKVKADELHRLDGVQTNVRIGGGITNIKRLKSFRQHLLLHWASIDTQLRLKPFGDLLQLSPGRRRTLRNQRFTSTKPHPRGTRLAVDATHQRDLATLLAEIALVDAEGVDPQVEVTALPRRPALVSVIAQGRRVDADAITEAPAQADEGRVKIRRHRHRQAVALDLEGRRRPGLPGEHVSLVREHDA
ncbi:hypothetical protein PG989_006400 [Apiospora arundinis]